jgi:autotransporter-associated beta strand protein
VPNGPIDVARFAGSSITSPEFSAVSTEVTEIVFTPEASSFTITANSELARTSVTLTISGHGLTNNSGVTQNLVAGPTVFPGGGGTIEFLNAATAGEKTVLTALGSDTDGAFSGSVINFHDTGTAGNATIVAEGANGRDDAGGGEVFFYNNTTAANASFTATGSNAPGGGGGEILFMDDSTAANANFTIEGESGGGLDGEVRFFDNSTAEDAQFTVTGGEVTFFDNSTAADATFTVEGAAVSGGNAGFVSFDFGGTGGNALFIANGGTTSGAAGGSVSFLGSSCCGNATAGDATLIANSGTNGGTGGLINFAGDDENEARVQLFGNGTLTVSFHTSGNKQVTIGSVEGDGLIVLGFEQKLIIGNNDLRTTFSGIISDSDSGSGPIEKIGTGSLTLTGRNTYRSGTIISGGILLVSNSSGSGTGTGTVSVDAGTLGGKGVIAGEVTVGTGSGAGAFLAPALGPKKQSTLRIQSALTFNSDATYTYTFRAKGTKARSDQVIVNGVTINSGAFFALQGTAQGTLPIGLSFTAINNTSANPIGGTFSNLPDSAILTVNGNDFQANYEGGDGNDLTLTVVP